MLHRTPILGFENDDGFRPYFKKQYIAPKKNIKLSVLKLKPSVLLRSGICYTLAMLSIPHPGHHSFFQEGASLKTC